MGSNSTTRRNKREGDRAYVFRKPRRDERHLESVGVGVEGVEALGLHAGHHRPNAARKLLANCQGNANKLIKLILFHNLYLQRQNLILYKDYVKYPLTQMSRKNCLQIAREKQEIKLQMKY